MECIKKTLELVAGPRKGNSLPDLLRFANISSPHSSPRSTGSWGELSHYYIV